MTDFLQLAINFRDASAICADNRTDETFQVYVEAKVAFYAQVARLEMWRSYQEQKKKSAEAFKGFRPFSEAESVEVNASFVNEDDSEPLEAVKRSGHLDSVREFMLKAGQKTRDVPASGLFEIPESERVRAASIVFEEAMELIRALGCNTFDGDGFSVFAQIEIDPANGPDMIQAVDGVFDVQYAASCVLAMMGVSDVRLRRLIDENNLSKFDGSESVSKLGKLVKPSGFKPVDIPGELEFMRRILKQDESVSN